MPGQEIEIPLFPLNVVLFPTMVLPILIFEERYKLMLNYCLETESDFGIALIKSGREVGGPAVPYEVGTTAHISGVEHKQDDKIHISVVGKERFTIVDITQETPYMMAKVRAIEDHQDNTNEEKIMAAATDIVRSCIKRLLGINGEWVKDIQLPARAADLSYLVAIRLPGEQPVKQQLLQAESPAKRLQMEIPLLKAEADRLERTLRTSMWMRSAAWN